MPKRKQKLIAVAYPAGRCGSSSVMGLLQKSGVFIGEESDLNEPTPYNSKGMFEINTLMNFYRKISPPSYTYPIVGPNIEEYERLVAPHAEDFVRVLDSIFGDAKSFAFKCPNYMALPMLNSKALSKRYNIKVVLLTRNREDQARSIQAVWSMWKSTFAKQGIVDAYVHQSYEFQKVVVEEYDLSYVPVTFENLLKKPVETSNKLLKKLAVKPPSDSVIGDWFDRSRAGCTKF